MATARPKSPKPSGSVPEATDRRKASDRRTTEDRRFFPRPEGRRKSGGRRATDRVD